MCDSTMPYDPERIYYVLTSNMGATFLPTALKPEDVEGTSTVLYCGVSPMTGRLDTALSYGRNYLVYDAEHRKLIQNMKPSDKVTLVLDEVNRRLEIEIDLGITFDSANYRTVCLWEHCTDKYSYDPDETYYKKDGIEFVQWSYNITQSEYEAGRELYYIKDGDEFLNCEEHDIPYDILTTYYREYLENYITVREYYFLFHQTEFYISRGFEGDSSNYYKVINNELINCAQDESFDINTTYAINIEKEYFTWRVQDGVRLVNSSDEYIHEGVTYYAQYDVYEPIEYVYDVTEENCAMYDYIEDNLYLLIQVPKDYDQNIVILEGDYTDTESEKIIDDNEVDLLPRPLVDYLYTSSLKMMELNTKQIIPFSKSLVEFLLWNVINNLDSINNNMDRLAYAVSSVVSNYDFQSQYINYWYPDFRKLVHEIGKNHNNKIVRDNLGYVTRNLEEVIYTTYNADSYIPDYVNPSELEDEEIE